MQGSWTEAAVLWKTSFGFILDINFLKICKSWVWAQIRRSKTPTLGVDKFSELVFFFNYWITTTKNEIKINNTAYSVQLPYIAGHSL